LRRDYSFIFAVFNQNVAICKNSHFIAILDYDSLIIFIFGGLLVVNLRIFVIAEEGIFPNPKN